MSQRLAVRILNLLNRQIAGSDTIREILGMVKVTLLLQVESHLLEVLLIKISQEIRKRGLDARIVASIHNSIWVEAPVDQEANVRGIMENVMTRAMSLSVRLVVDFEAR